MEPVMTSRTVLFTIISIPWVYFVLWAVFTL